MPTASSRCRPRTRRPARSSRSAFKPRAASPSRISTAWSRTPKRMRELVEAKNSADALIHTTERTLSEAGDKVPEGDKDAVQQAIQALKDTLGGDDTAQIKAKTEALAQASMKVGEALYKAQQAQQAGAGEGGPSSGGAAGGGGA